MTIRPLLLAALCLGCSGLAQAQGRDLPRMKTLARQALTAIGAASANVPLHEQRSLKHCSVLAAEGGGFAVVSADGQQLLGVSATGTTGGTNPEFEWWLDAVDEALARHAAHLPNYDLLRPNPKKYPISVEPLLQTHWGQLDPYNRKCFYDSLKQERTAVGCVATSMAQVFNYYQAPERGQGRRTVYYPYQDSINGQSLTVDFADVTYRWDLFQGMENFRTQPFTDEQADAISTLLLHLGVAADMRYGTQDVSGSATTAAAAAEGMRTYLGQPDAQVVYRDSYDDEEWFDMVFREISTGHPVIYGGQAFSGGHSFVLNGYDRNGLVYVNWGWNGDSEGYYNLGLLNPGGTSFSDRQDMIVGIFPTVYAPLAAQVVLAQAGTLAEELAQADMAERSTLTVSGPMNEADFAALRAAVQTHGVGTLDLSGALFDALPPLALYGCDRLFTLRLPAGLKHIGDGALGDLRFLSDLTLEPADDADFTVDGHIIYNKERTEIISVLSTASGSLVVEPTVTAIHPYAFCGCVLLQRVELPATITTLGAETFRNCYWLEELKVRSKTVITLQGYNIFDGIDKSICTLYVPSGLKTTYSRRAQWKDFNDVVEFGTTVKAANAVRRQGEPNPELAYTITGDPVSGTPHLWTDATESSPAGVYTIYVEAGTITAPDVEYVNGRLIVEESTEGIGANVETNRSETTTTYDLQGRKANGQSKGVVIGRHANGQVTKHLK